VSGKATAPGQPNRTDRSKQIWRRIRTPPPLQSKPTILPWAFPSSVRASLLITCANPPF